MATTRIGFGYDVHRYAAGRRLWLGGIEIAHDKGLLGHSDADVLLHAIADALLGAASLRDIGYHFPNTAQDTLALDSKILLAKTMQLLRREGYAVGNIDATVIAEAPHLSPHIDAMRRTIASIVGVDVEQVSVKATTNEGMGFVGRGEGIAACAVALLFSL